MPTEPAIAEDGVGGAILSTSLLRGKLEDSGVAIILHRHRNGVEQYRRLEAISRLPVVT
ncbi:hypothetical protein BGZ58_000794, partial [Dissophora ornata]